MTTMAGQQQQYATGYPPSNYPVQYQPGSTDMSGQASGGSSYAYGSNPAEGEASRSHSYGNDQGSGAQSLSSGGGSTARRREQNRMAQRALRQRKETHLRELENRIINARFSTRHLEAENEELERQLQNVNQENEFLRTSTMLEPYGTQSDSPSAQGYDSLAYDLPGQISVNEPSYTLSNWAFDERVDPAFYDLNLEQSGEPSYGEGSVETDFPTEDLTFYEEWQR